MICVHKNIKDLKCDHCSYTTGRPRALVVHKLRHQKSQPLYKCSLCLNTYVSKKARSEHMTSDHNTVERLQCDSCSFTTVNIRLLRSHKQSHLDIRVLHKCAECPKSYTVKESLKTHMRRAHSKEGSSPQLVQENVVGTYKCDLCAFSANNQKWLSKHIEIKHS